MSLVRARQPAEVRAGREPAAAHAVAVEHEAVELLERNLAHLGRRDEQDAHAQVDEVAQRYGVEHGSCEHGRVSGPDAPSP